MEAHWCFCIVTMWILSKRLWSLRWLETTQRLCHVIVMRLHACIYPNCVLFIKNVCKSWTGHWTMANPEIYQFWFVNEAPSTKIIDLFDIKFLFMQTMHVDLYFVTCVCWESEIYLFVSRPKNYPAVSFFCVSGQCYDITKTRTTRTPAFWDTPRRPMITHTSDSHQIPSQINTKSKLQI